MSEKTKEDKEAIYLLSAHEQLLDAAWRSGKATRDLRQIITGKSEDVDQSRYSTALSLKDSNNSEPHFIRYHSGNFFCNGKRIDFPEPNANYALLVKVLLLQSDAEGFCSYEVIDKFFVANGADRLNSKSEKQKRVANALQSLWRERMHQKVPFPKETPQGDATIEVISGKGLRLNNPKI